LGQEGTTTAELKFTVVSEPSVTFVGETCLSHPGYNNVFVHLLGAKNHDYGIAKETGIDWDLKM